MLPGLTHKEIENLNRFLTSKEVESVIKNFSRVCQNEVSQKEKNKYHVQIHISGIQRNGVDEPICRAAVDAENGCVDTLGVGWIGRLGLTYIR